MRHNANLDILRTFAVSAVVVQHLVTTLVTHAGFHDIAVIEFTGNIGRAGVIAFFVHTSLVLMYSLERMARTAGRISARFYIRRFFRIYPLSVFCIVLAVVFHVPSNTWKVADVISPPVVLSNLLLVQNLITKVSVIGPLWSLPYEVQMYLVLPSLYYLVNRRRSTAYLCGLMVFFCCVGTLIAWHFGGHLNMAAYVPCFLSGVLCYSLRDRIQPFIPSALWPPLVLLLISGYCLTNIGEEPRFWIGWIYCLVLGLAINAFHDSTNRPLNVVAKKIALYSYGIYLIHVPVLFLVFMLLGIHDLVFGPLLFVALTIAASVFTYHLIEFPFVAVGRKLSSRPLPIAGPLSTQEISP